MTFVSERRETPTQLGLSQSDKSQHTAVAEGYMIQHTDTATAGTVGCPGHLDYKN